MFPIVKDCLCAICSGEIDVVVLNRNLKNFGKPSLDRVLEICFESSDAFIPTMLRSNFGEMPDSQDAIFEFRLLSQVVIFIIQDAVGLQTRNDKKKTRDELIRDRIDLKKPFQTPMRQPNKHIIIITMSTQFII